MSELLNCPLCGANKPFRTVTPENGIPSGDSGYRMTIKCRDRECGCIITRWALKKAWAIESAETAWNRRTQPANEPLTLEQLREMGDIPHPVYLVSKKYEGANGWRIFRGICARTVCFDTEAWGLSGFSSGDILAYLRPPGRSENDG